MKSGSVNLERNTKDMAEYRKFLDALNLKELVAEFLSYLDATDESESGTVFHPVHISCCRALWTEPLNIVLKKMREEANEL